MCSGDTRGCINGSSGGHVVDIPFKIRQYGSSRNNVVKRLDQMPVEFFDSAGFKMGQIDPDSFGRMSAASGQRLECYSRDDPLMRRHVRLVENLSRRFNIHYLSSVL